MGQGGECPAPGCLGGNRPVRGATDLYGEGGPPAQPEAPENSPLLALGPDGSNLILPGALHIHRSAGVGAEAAPWEQSRGRGKEGWGKEGSAWHQAVCRNLLFPSRDTSHQPVRGGGASGTTRGPKARPSAPSQPGWCSDPLVSPVSSYLAW